MDLISRQAVLDKAYVMDLADTGNDIQVRVVDVDDIIRLSSELRWRLSAEELPDCNEEVLVCYIPSGWICIDELDGDGTFVYWDVSNLEVDKTAWMPLPEPYKGGER